MTEEEFRSGVKEDGSRVVNAVVMLERVIKDLKAAHEARVTGLLEANNREVETRRAATRDMETWRMAFNNIRHGYAELTDANQKLRDALKLATMGDTMHVRKPEPKDTAADGATQGMPDRTGSTY